MNEEWVSQIKRGTLEFVIMSLIQNKDRYGYDVIQTLDSYPMLKTQESTIYPLLRRLLKNGYLESYWRNMGEGIPARKYYKITKLGISYLNQLNDDWETLVKNIAELRRG
ncbi:PadR family transcriptional regulator [Clostridiales bacterium COT073_COT-073]|nr:PadR family transcriptional regulator [Clostridiales bacterium COT073_COT-073]